MVYIHVDAYDWVNECVVGRLACGMNGDKKAGERVTVNVGESVGKRERKETNTEVHALTHTYAFKRSPSSSHSEVHPIFTRLRRTGILLLGSFSNPQCLGRSIL